MTGVPFPSLLRYEGSEVRGPDVLNGRGEPQQPPSELLPVRVLPPFSVGSFGQNGPRNYSGFFWNDLTLP